MPGFVATALAVGGCFDTKPPTSLTRPQVVEQLLLTTDDGGHTYVDSFDCAIVAILPNRPSVRAAVNAGQAVVTNSAGTIAFRPAKPGDRSCRGHLEDDLDSLAPAS